MVFSTNVSLFGLAVWTAIANIYTNIHIYINTRKEFIIIKII